MEKLTRKFYIFFISVDRTTDVVQLRCIKTMSQLRKSASFRSRIPVRRTRVPQRRCSSPQPTSSSNSRNTRHSSKNTQLWYDRRYSSSSYSSSDESDESEAPLQVININQIKC